MASDRLANQIALLIIPKKALHAAPVSITGYNSATMDDETTEIYDALGSDAPFYALVDAFYAGIETDTLVRPMYPTDLTESKEHMTLFLIQRFGGHGQYGEKRGHPRLRMRHMPFRIGEAEKNAWLRHMMAAIEATPEFHPFRESLHQYFEDSAAFLVNKNEIPAIELPKS